MINKLLFNKTAMLLAALFFSLASYCQLPDFTLTVVPTAATCPGNGQLSLSVTGINPAASISYAIYLLPNEADAVTVVNAGPVLNRPAGTYKIVATQSLAPNTPVVKTTTVTITDLFVPLNYTSDIENVKCGNDGKITVNNLSGTIVSYSLIAPSPILRPVQPSNIFAGLPAGTYRIQVITTCNETVNFDRIIGTTNTAMVIDPGIFEIEQLPACGKIRVSHHFGAVSGNQIIFPLVFTFTVTPPGGGTPIIVTQTVASGTNFGNDVVVDLPFFNGQQYSYTVTANNSCGTPTTRPNNIVNRKFEASVAPDIVNCGDNVFSIQPTLYKPPYTVQFQTAPPTFVATNYYPVQSFTGNIQYGQANNGVPEGNYVLLITDACGSTTTKTFLIEDPDIEPTITGEVEGCSPGGTISITINGGRDLVKVEIKAAPSNYGIATPHNVSSSIGADGFERDNMPVGNYQIEITDSCGDVYLKLFTLVGTPSTSELLVQQRAGCDLGDGSVRLSIDPQLVFTTVWITQAPAAFGQPLPYNATSLISTNNLYMNNLPAGNYTFETTDSCGTPRNKTIAIEGYTITSATNYAVIHRCGSFDLQLSHVSNGNYVPSFWLQKYNPGTNSWGHPGTGVAYPQNTLPNATNSVPLINNQINIYQPYTGQFRILKSFYTYSTGSAANNRCVSIVGDPFLFDGNPKITGVHAFPCSNALTEVAVDAIGAAPLQYKIISKNGNTSFTVNNGTSPLFTGLEPATYVFTVTDNCGNTFPYPTTINVLDPITVTATGFCEGQDSSLSVQQFSFLSYQWYEQSAPTVILSTNSYLNFPAFSSANDVGVYRVRIISSTANSCLNQILPPYTINANQLPNAGPDKSDSICNSGDTINIATYLGAPHDTGGTWTEVTTSGQFTGTQFNTTGLTAGTYRFKYTVTGNCSSTDDAFINITLKNKPQPPVPAAVPQICGVGTVNLSVAAVPGATGYSWTGPDNFTSNLQNPVITNADSSKAGLYQVTVTVDGCTSLPAQTSVMVMPLPQFHLEADATQLCNGQSTIIRAVPEVMGAINIVQGWYQDGEQIPGEFMLSIEATEPGLYEVEMSNGACTGPRQAFTITAGTIAEAIVLDSGCNNNDEYVVYVVNAADFPGATYEWSGPDGFTATGEEAIITGLAEGDYTVTVNFTGCEKAQPLTVLNTFCKILRGISPNGDGRNDALDLSNFDVTEIQIFNRYGLKVYEQANYVNEWHGQSDKGDLPTGTYFYVISMESGKQVTGWVYLQREL